jgi:nitroimidazol reductase NimA-like FMN-containing flavoprotein (pyridoxamine 5'-phosphate oxidase superfamily)
MERRNFDVDAFLAQPLTARLATARPAVRPVWFLWEDGYFWVLTGPWSKLPADIGANPTVALVVDTCDLATGECLQVIARGHAELLPFDRERGHRKLARYLGPDPDRWDSRFQEYLSDQPDALWVRIGPVSLVANDLSFSPSIP